MRRFILCFTLAAALMIPARSAGSDGRWHPAVVDEMAGRYGAFMEGYRYRKLGHLALISDGLDVYSITFGENIFLGRPHLPSAYSYKESFNWVGVERSFDFKDKDGRDQRLQVYESLLAPGFLYRTSQSVFRWCWHEQIPGKGLVLPLASGIVCREEGERYLAGLHGPLSSPWMLVSFRGSRQPHDCPLLFIFERAPREIEVVTHEFLDIRFSGPAGKIIVMPLYGVRKMGPIRRSSPQYIGQNRVPENKSKTWADLTSAGVAEKCARWRERLLHYPVGCSEEYRFSANGDSLTVRNSYSFVSFEDAAGPPLSPLPPMLNAARLTGYPVRVEEPLVEAGYPTNYGPLDYVRGETATYTIPACLYVDRTLAPVRVKGVEGIGKIEEALAAYIARPGWLWPGDHDYFLDDVMDTLHNLRLLAWATWSLPEPGRRRAIEQLARPGLSRLGDENNRYFFFEDPVAGAAYARDSTIFAQRGKTSYDSDWYNGFQLAGFWAYRYFGDRKHGLRLARKHWHEISGLYKYMEIYHDWALCCSVTDPRGNLTDYDCMRNGWSGILAYARLARDLGRHEEYSRARYLASKNMVSHYTQWTLQDFFYDWAASYAPDSGKGYLRHAREEITGIERIDGYGSLDLVAPDDRSPYNLSANIPEHSLLLSDFGLRDKVALLTHDLMPKHIPDWADFDPYASRGRPGSWGAANAAGARYFYFIDPHLFVRAINLNEPLEKLLSYRRLEWLSGQAIEAMLVGSRPMLVVPTDVEFYGNLWDEKERSLTFTLGTGGEERRSVVEIRNCPEIREISPAVLYDYDPAARKALLRLKISAKTSTRVSF